MLSRPADIKLPKMSDPAVEQVACRKCEAEMPADAQVCPDCGAVQKLDRAPTILVVLLLASSLLLMSSSFVNLKQTFGEPVAQAAAAVPVVKQEPVEEIPK